MAVQQLQQVNKMELTRTTLAAEPTLPAQIIFLSRTAIIGMAGRQVGIVVIFLAAATGQIIAGRTQALETNGSCSHHASGDSEYDC